MRQRLTLRQYYEGTWWLLLAWLACLTYASETVGLVTLLSASAICIASASPRWNHAIPRFLKPAMAVALLALGMRQYFEDRDVVWIFSHTLFALLPFLLPRRETFTGYWTSLIACVVFALIDLLAGDGLAEFLVFIAFASTLVFSLNAAHLFFYVGPNESRLRRVPPRYFMPFIGSAASGLTVGILLFVFFPRAIQWQNPFGLRQKSSQTGYSGGVTLEGVSISESQNIAMLVEASDTYWLQYSAPFLLLRGNTLEAFDGKKWSTSAHTRIPYLSPADVQTTSALERRFIRLKIYREMHSTPAIVYAGVLRDAVFPRNVLGGIFVDENKTLMRQNKADLRYSYSLTISPTTRPSQVETLTRAAVQRKLARPAKLKHSLSTDSASLSRFLAIPESVKSAPYFKKWVNEAGAMKENDTMGAIFLGLMKHFRTDFRVGYQAGANGVDSLEKFLGEGRYGHCEYFATAAVLYLRAMGIPARLALGYRGGTFNPVSQVLEVREANAHAWTEAYVPDVGWVSFDPTPVIIRPTTPTVWQSARSYFAAAKFWLERYLVDYNLATQSRLYQGLRETTIVSSSVGWDARRWRRLGVLLLALLAAMGAIAAYTFRRRSLSRATLPRYYRVFLQRAAHLGWKREPNETYAAFHARLMDSGRFSQVVSEVDAGLQQDLYSSKPLDKAQRRRLFEIVRLHGVES